MPSKRRQSKAEAQARVDELLRLAPIAVSLPMFDELAQRRPVEAAIWRALAERAASAIAAQPATREGAALAPERGKPNGGRDG
jgi:hypothetical protein